MSQMRFLVQLTSMVCTRVLELGCPQSQVLTLMVVGFTTSNFFVHLVLTLMVVGFTVRWAPAPLENMEQEWVREVDAPAWGTLHSEG